MALRRFSTRLMLLEARTSCVLSALAFCLAMFVSQTAKCLAEPAPAIGKLYILAYEASQATNDSTARDPISDAQEVADSIAAAAKPISASAVKILITDDRSPGASISKACAGLAAQVRPEDIFIFYFAGSYALADTAIPNVKDMRLTPYQGSGAIITAAELGGWLAKIHAGHQLIVLDTTCPTHLFQRFRTKMSEAETDPQELTSPQIVIWGSNGQKTALRGGQGVFATALHDALSGKMPSLGGSGVVSIHQMEGYLVDHVLELSGQAVRLNVSDDADDFPVVFIDLQRGSRAGNDRGGDAPLSRHGSDYALLIGTNTYDHFDTLTNPIHDIDSISNELKQTYHFNVREVSDTGCDEIWNDIHDFLHPATPPQQGDQYFIFVAGHGYYDEPDHLGFIICKDSKTIATDYGGSTRISYLALQQYINYSPCHHVFLVLDVCFGGTFANTVRAVELDNGNEKVLNESQIEQYIMGKKSRIYLTSVGNDFASDGDGFHSPFAQRLLDTLSQFDLKPGYLRTSDIFSAAEKDQQQPTYGVWGDDEAGGDFIFIAPPPP